MQWKLVLGHSCFSPSQYNSIPLIYWHGKYKHLFCQNRGCKNYYETVCNMDCKYCSLSHSLSVCFFSPAFLNFFLPFPLSYFPSLFLFLSSFLLHFSPSLSCCVFSKSFCPPWIAISCSKYQQGDKLYQTFYLHVLYQCSEFHVDALVDFKINFHETRTFVFPVFPFSCLLGYIFVSNGTSPH